VEAAGDPQETKPHERFNEVFNAEETTHEGSATFRLPFKVKPGTPSGPLTIKAELKYMACDVSRCLMPQTFALLVPITVTGDAVASGTAPPQPPAQGTSPAPPPAQTPVSKDGSSPTGTPSQQDGLLAFLLAAVAAGFFALGTPCVFPMIPITVSFFAKQAEQKSVRSPVGLATVYCAGIISTFTVLGLATAVLLKSSTSLQNFSSNPWVNTALALLFFIFALNLFGAFEIRIPTGLVNKLQRTKTSSAHLSALLMALVFTITSFTCTFAFVGGLLTAAAGGEFFRPVLGMLVFSTVFAVPFFLLALFPQFVSKLPQAGGWMNSIKVSLGFVETAAAIYYLSRADLQWDWQFLTRPVYLAMWSGLALMTGLYLLGKFRLPHDYDEVQQIGVPRMLAAGASFTFSLYLGGAMLGLPVGQFLAGLLPPADYGGYASAGPSGTQHGESLTWIEDYDQAKTEALADGKRMFLDFTGVTCTNCRAMEQTMFPRPPVRERLAKFVRARLWIDKGPTQKQNAEMLQKRFGTSALPHYIILDPKTDQVLGTAEFTYDVEAFVDFLNKGLGREMASR
jgi:thiol:disulfide interchange protein